MSGNKTVFLDELTWHSVIKLFLIPKVSNITVLGVIASKQKFFKWILKRRGISVTEAQFFAGHLKTADGESVYLNARRIAGQLALVAAKKIIQSDSLLLNLNETYKRNTILLFVARHLRPHVEYYIIRQRVVEAINDNRESILWVRQPQLFDEEIVENLVNGVNILFYPLVQIESYILVKNWILNVARDLKLISGIGRKSVRKFDWKGIGQPSVLMIQEDTLRVDQGLRGQPHWINANKPDELIRAYVIKLGGTNTDDMDAEAQLSDAGVTVLSPENFRYADYANRKNKTLSRIRAHRAMCLRRAVKLDGFTKKYFLIQIAFLLRQAQLMGALALSLNAKVFLIRESYYTLSDAMQLVSADLQITTVAYQYSNIGFTSTGMLTTADKFLTFSKMYEEIYTTSGGISPKEFIPVGYLYNHIPAVVHNKAMINRNILRAAGAKFIVCYLDESVQHDRWGLVSVEDHLDEIHSLARLVIKDPTFGVVIKSQFILNTPNKLYPNDEIINAAKATGRYLELADGIHRNDIYPAEAALVSDFCIGHKFGATAALEAAVAGVRTVLLDKYGTKTHWDGLYAQADIEYETMGLVLNKIEEYRFGNSAQTLGNWDPILHHFDAYRDGSAVIRLRETVRSLVLAV